MNRPIDITEIIIYNILKLSHYKEEKENLITIFFLIISYFSQTTPRIRNHSKALSY